MPKSKRSKVVHLSKTQKKGSAIKEKLVEDVRECVDSYKNIFVIRVHNMRNASLKDLRQIWGTSRFFFGKNKVMVHALGRGPEDEHADNLSKLSKRVVGDRGILFTNSSKDEVLKFFADYSEPNYARSGCVANEDISIQKGNLTLPFSMEVHLRKLGLSTKLNNGVVELLADTVICRKGDVLTPEQCKLLEIFEIQMAEFRIEVDCMWSQGGEFEQIGEDEEGEECSEGDDNMDQ